MGLFDFIRNAGKKILGKGDDNKEIVTLIKTDLSGQVRDLEVDFKDGVVTISGECDSRAAAEKAMLLAGNINGVGHVNDDGLRFPAEVETEYYTIVSGDSLSKIAKKYYGDAMKYPVIFEANREVIKDADLIYPGQKIRIPKL